MFKRYWWMLFVMAPMGAITGLLVAAVVTYMMPKVYESSAVIEIGPPGARPLSDAKDRDPGTFSRTESEKIRSRNSLMGVVETLDLPNKWAMDRQSALLVLKDIVRTENIHGTDLHSITVRHTNMEDARDIAAEVVRAYKDYTETIEMNAGRDLVMVHEDPVIADLPVSPNVTLNLVAGAVGGLLISPLLALPLMWMVGWRHVGG